VIDRIGRAKIAFVGKYAEVFADLTFQKRLAPYIEFQTRLGLKTGSHNGRNLKNKKNLGRF
jgi:hypothetical protein